MSKFQAGDEVAITKSVIVDYVSGDGSAADVRYSPYGPPFAVKTADLTMVKAKAPARPKAGTLISVYGDRYIVNSKGDLTYVSSLSGKPDSYTSGNWDGLDHRDGGVKIIG